MVRRSAYALVGTALLLGMVLGLVLGRATRAQESIGEDGYSAAEREELYASLGNEAAQLEREAKVLRTIAKLVSPTVVHIKAEKSDTSPRRGRRDTIEEAGSGVVIEVKGKFYILTNRHVIKDAQRQQIQITLDDGRELTPSRDPWQDADTDVAVMPVSATGLVPAKLGDSSTVEIGDFVLAVGSPFGLSHSVTYGIISAKGRRDLELGEDVELQDFLQTDAAINPGNSGGPLINLRGEVIGINTAIASNSGGNEGIGFSIPVNMVSHIVRQLIERGRVVRAFLGVTLDHKFNTTTAVKLGLPRRQGARINGITPGSPAAVARLEVGDVVLRFNGVRVEDDTHLIYLVSLTEVGKDIPVVAFRDGKLLNLSVKVGNKADYPR